MSPEKPIWRSQLRWRDLLGEALAAVGQRPARTMLTALGTTLGVAAFVSTVGLGATAKAQVSARFDALEATEVRVQPKVADTANPFPDDAQDRLERLNGVRHAGVYFSVDGRNLQPRSSPAMNIRPTAPVPIIAADSGAIKAGLASLGVGRSYDLFHEGRAERVAILGSAAATSLNVRVDGQSAIWLGDVPYTVIGVIDKAERLPALVLAIIIPVSAAERDFPARLNDFQVIIDVEPGSANLAGRQAPIALRPDAPSILVALVPPDPDTLRNQISSDMTGLFLALAAVALVIGSVAIANATLLSVIERRTEIGLRRALGYTRRHIRHQIVVEAGVIGTVGGVSGTAVGLAAITVVSMLNQWTATINPVLVAVAPLTGMLTGIGAGIVPAWKASRTPPVAALRS